MFKFTYRNADGYCWNVWKETETINGHQKRITIKYNFHKWCYLKIEKYETNKNWCNK